MNVGAADVVTGAEVVTNTLEVVLAKEVELPLGLGNLKPDSTLRQEVLFAAGRDSSFDVTSDFFSSVLASYAGGAFGNPNVGKDDAADVTPLFVESPVVGIASVAILAMDSTDGVVVGMPETIVGVLDDSATTAGFS